MLGSATQQTGDCLSICDGGFERSLLPVVHVIPHDVHEGLSFRSLNLISNSCQRGPSAGADDDS